MIGLRTQNDERSESAEGVSGFEAFFRTHYRAVVRLARSVVTDSQAAQDVAQDAFLAAYRRFGEDCGQAAGWVRVAAVHTALNSIRAERRRDRRQQLVPGPGSGPSVEEAVIGRETRGEVRRVLARMPRRSAALLVMRHGGMSYLEIADALGVKVGHVGTLLRRAEASLRKEMEHETPR